MNFLNRLFFTIKKMGTSLVVQWLRLCAPNAGGPSLIPAQGTRSYVLHLKTLPAATKIQHSQISKYKQNKTKGHDKFRAGSLLLKILLYM